ncbi:MAG: cellulose biosynthesis protein BcsG [Pseudomonadales bacterium]|uniref:cellulose biosynthesis protein BcsG n=1 Tax=Pseudomonas TaxID=286 RepID=UPI0002BD7237|nr:MULTISPECIES: cellulose biosynthesis protein BcsG [unclassified Pseudomonas]AUB75525.1 cellulose synthase [Pseudomonas sp. Lz4W]MCB1655086.1 cellulose biosynthesis protein BcsG [Pseudomonadales bacterium]NBG92700.1 cellulose biosynthesis protein BcsG [Pseudomonas sp. 9.1(2019)]RUT42128.1 cellulose biosynthesis protein BcsG [Pseudomonas sp. PAMC 29040]
MSLSKPASPAHKISGSWRGLGAWNVYFLGKFLLTWTGHLNFQVLPNLIFALVLLIPIGHPMLRRARTLIAIPVAVALLYQDTWFPPFSRLLAQPGVLDFSFDYIVELLGRFIDWQVCAMLLLLVVGYLFLSQWLRLTTFTLLGFAWLSMGSLQWLLPPAADQQMASTQPGQTAQAGSGGEPDDATLNGYLDKFYLAESSRKVEFKDPAVKPPPFDLLVINICSMAWDDLDAVGLRDNSLFSQMDVIFDNFNSATAYSGPAAIRLLRASCGQTSHAQLYKPPADQCLLFDDLRKLGFSDELMLNHTGEFDGFLQEVREQGELPQPALGVVPAGLPRTYVGFDGSPIWRDRDVLSKWWQHRLNEKQPNMALFYNTTTLHDGNRQVQSDGGTQAADYSSRAQLLLDDLNSFLKELQKSGRRVVVAIVPEHGAALHGDRMQIAGMREIPSDSITHVPVGIKLINMGDNGQTAPVHITEPSSYLAVAEIIARLYADPALSNGQTVDWTKLLTDLPQTAKVSENSGTVVLDYNGKPYVRIKENGGWLPYPQKLK